MKNPQEKSVYSKCCPPPHGSQPSILQKLRETNTDALYYDFVTSLHTALRTYNASAISSESDDTLKRTYQDVKACLKYAQDIESSLKDTSQPASSNHYLSQHITSGSIIKAIQEALIFMAIQQKDIETLSSLLITNKNLVERAQMSFDATKLHTPIQYAQMLLENSKKNDIIERQRILDCIKDGGINVNNLVAPGLSDFRITIRWEKINSDFIVDTNTGRTYHIQRYDGIMKAIILYILTFGLFAAASHILAITLGLHLPLYFFPAATGLLYVGHILSRFIGCLSGIVSHPYRQLTDKKRTYHVSIDKTHTYNACLEILSDCAILIKSIIVALISPLCFLCMVCPFLTLNGQKWLSRLENWATSRLTGYPGEPILVGCMGERGWRGSAKGAAQKGYLLCNEDSLPPKTYINIRHLPIMPRASDTLRCLQYDEPIHPRPIPYYLRRDRIYRFRVDSAAQPNK